MGRHLAQVICRSFPWVLVDEKKEKNKSNDNENYLKQFSPLPQKLLNEKLACPGCLFNDFFVGALIWLLANFFRC